MARATATAAWPDTKPNPPAGASRSTASSSRAPGRPRITSLLTTLATNHANSPPRPRAKPRRTLRKAAATRAVAGTATMLPSCMGVHTRADGASGRSFIARKAPTSAPLTVAALAGRALSAITTAPATTSTASKGWRR